MQTQAGAQSSLEQKIINHQQQLRQCQRCPQMSGPVITGLPVAANIMLIGQAPGIHEAEVQKPFGWTAGKTLFSWFEQIGMTEQQFRHCVYIASVCRCFPGKQINKQGKTGGDRVPDRQEIANCADWMAAEFALLEPELIICVGKLAISRFMQVNKLADIIGQTLTITIRQRPVSMIPLPHPSGASTWHRTEPGKTLLQQALRALGQHPAWLAAREATQPGAS